MDDLISQVAFKPSRIAHPDYVQIQTDHETLTCYFHKQTTSPKTLVYFHGNAEVVEHYVGSKSFAVGLAVETGANLFAVEYPGYGASSGSPKLVQFLQAIPHIHQKLTKGFKISENDIFVYGRSIGSIYALHFAYLFPNIAGLIIEAGFSEMKGWCEKMQKRDANITDQYLQDCYTECDIYFNHKEKIEKYKGPLLILHAQDDHLVPIKHADDLFSWSKSTEKKLVSFRLGRHNVYAWCPDLYWASLKAFIGLREQHHNQEEYSPNYFAIGLMAIALTSGIAYYMTKQEK